MLSLLQSWSTLLLAVHLAGATTESGILTGPAEDGMDTSQGPWLPSILEDLAIRDNKVMRNKPTSYVVNRPPSGGYNPDRNGPPNKPTSSEVTETDLYLLGAIEKLVYRVDLMEKRLRRTEELLYHVMEGQNTKREDVCPGNFTRVSHHCYHFSDRQYNWKSAASMCKSLGANLVEVETRDDFRELVTFLQADPFLRGKDYWTGGLNPGLLWLWSNSARPVFPHQNRTGSGGRPEDTVHGSGRCLQLGHSSVSRLYQYTGAECNARARYICQHEESNALRALKRIQKAISTAD